MGEHIMAKMGIGYGSEAHLLRYLGRHRDLLNSEILRLIPATSIRWLDFGFDRNKEWPDAEIVRLDFLPDKSQARQQWPSVWPSNGTQINWDAVAELQTEHGQEWLLIEAKANIQEIHSNCGASESGGLPLIRATLDRTKAALGAAPGADWLNGHYQAANRIVALQHLTQHGVRAHLMFIYFCGDRGDAARNCPTAPGDWGEALSVQAKHLGLPPQHPLSDRIQRLFLDVCLA
jgi:hypothetical protein